MGPWKTTCHLDWILYPLVFALSFSAAARGALPEIEFDRQIKPILAAHCVKCHGPRKREAGLRLDTAITLLDGGDRGPSVIAGKPEMSLLFKAVTGSDEDVEKMPPAGPGLTPTQLGLLKAWIEQGAQAPEHEVIEQPALEHWAFDKPQRPKLPELTRTDDARRLR